jgi:hypothetical protein
MDGYEWPTLPDRPRTLLYAWESWWCPTCGGRTFRADASCCDAPMLPVRLEMHSREPG